jgi:alkanesulfonate monooxygenase SsuD/methylene tetrahydromethanopterin reductase-like flavin-dependent oxidoreductase (luciferase family)
VRIGFSLPTAKGDGTSHSAAEVMQRARLLESLGFDGIWVGDQIGRGSTRPDPLMSLLAAAIATQHVEVGTAVIQLPLRRSVELAQRLLTLHTMSRGRFRAGLGSGSTRADFAAVGVPYEERFRLLREGLATIQCLFRGERVGEADLKVWPDAIPGPPILIGSWASSVWVRRAARDYDGWLTSGAGPGGNRYINLREGIRLFRAEGGKRAIVATVPVDFSRDSPSISDDLPFTLQCGPEEALERVQRVAELGFDDILLRGDNFTDEQVIEVAEELRLKPRTE